MHIFRHFAMIVKHKHYVFIHCCRAGIPWRGLWHDMSKFNPVEFFTSAKFYTGKGSPIRLERKERGFSNVWMHHSKRNKHHYEYWTDYDVANENIVPVKMPVVYVAEMFCDMIAANKAYKRKDHKDSDGIEYFRKNRLAERMHPDTAKLLESFFICLAEHGEAEAFCMVKAAVRKKDY